MRRHVWRWACPTRLALHAPDFVPHAVEQRLAQVGLKRTLVTRLELADSLDDVREGVLDQVVGVEGAPGPGRQTPVGPALASVVGARAEALRGIRHAGAGFQDQLKRRFAIRRSTR